MRRNRLLLAGGGYADIPLIRAAQNLGYYVVTTGSRTEELGHQVSDEYCPADYSDPDAMLELGRALDITAICPCCNDFSAISCAYVAEQLGLPGHDPLATSQLIHHKDSYREFAQENEIPTPLAMGFSDVDAALSITDDFRYPLIIKPVDMTGGKGITRVDNKSEYKVALNNAFSIGRSGRVVVEEFIEGSRHGFSAFIRDGKVVFHFSDNEYYYLNQYMVSAASTPTTVDAAGIQELVYRTEQVAGLLKLGTGIFHVQFIMRGDEPVIIEICRRPPGDLYIKLVEYATGVDYPDWIVKAFCGLDCSGLEHREVDGYYLRHCIMSAQTGVLHDIEIDPSVKENIIDSVLWWKPGDRVENCLVDKFGILFFKFKSQQELLDSSEEMQKLVHPVIESV